MNFEKLRSMIDGQVLDDEETLLGVSSDFGRISRRIPAALVAPASPRDVRSVVDFANREGVTVAVRGAGHSQSGQALSDQGILLDMAALNRVGKPEEGAIWAESGATWAQVADSGLERGWVPPVLTNLLEATVGGTLSTGGLGAASHRFGAQVDHVLELEVITGGGDLVRCSPAENRELFDCVRGGLGQFAVITRARLALRPAQSSVRTFYLLYDRLEHLTEDLAAAALEDRFDFVEAWCTPCLQGLRSLGGARVSFAEWFYPVQLSVEYSSSAPSDTFLDGLRHYRRVYTEDLSLREFLCRMEPLHQIWREAGAWNLCHPWMEVLLPWEKSAQFIEGVLKSFPPNLMTGGQVVLRPLRRLATGAPFLMCPAGDLAMGFGILPSVPRQLLGMAASLLNRAGDLAMQIGGCRYPAGWVEFDHQHWKDHFRNEWSRLVQLKKFLDPAGILNPGFVKYEES